MYGEGASNVQEDVENVFIDFMALRKLEYGSKNSICIFVVFGDTAFLMLILNIWF